VRPDTNAVGVRGSAIGFDFDEVISERPQGATTLAELFLISPSRGQNELSWRRTRVEVAPRGGLRPNTTYRVTMLPGMTDLDGNMDSVGTTLVFSTGPTIAAGSIRGRVFDWMEERPARGAMVEALVLPESLRYLAVADSLGAYRIDNVPTGSYVLRALVDQNRNRLLDPREIFDTTTIALTDSLERVLHAIQRDTVGPGIERIEIVDTLTLRVRMDRAIDTSLTLGTSLFTLRKSDSTLVPLRGAIGGRAFKRLADDSARAKAVQDSVRRAAEADSAARADTATRLAARPPVRPAPPPRAAPARGTVRGAVRDTTPPPKPTVRLPDNEVILQLESPLPEGTNFRLRAEGVRSVVGRVRPTERQFSTPRPSRAELARRDSLAKARADSARRDTTRRDTLAGGAAGGSAPDLVGVARGWEWERVATRHPRAGAPPRFKDAVAPRNGRHRFIAARTTSPQPT
jgi:hypothetical protein